MQAVTEREEKVAFQLPEQSDVAIQYFFLQEELSSEHRLALNPASGTLAYLVWDGRQVQMVLQQQFTSSELSLLVPLLKSYPYYCPYDVMYAHFYNGTITEEEIAQARRHLQNAMNRGTWEQEMKPVRNVLSRTRAKLQPFGYTISSILETGYIVRVSTRSGPV